MAAHPHICPPSEWRAGPKIHALCRNAMPSEPLAIPTKKRGPVTSEVLMTRAAERHAGQPMVEDVMPEDAQALKE